MPETDPNGCLPLESADETHDSAVRVVHGRVRRGRVEPPTDPPTTDRTRTDRTTDPSRWKPTLHVRERCRVPADRDRPVQGGDRLPAWPERPCHRQRSGLACARAWHVGRSMQYLVFSGRESGRSGVAHCSSSAETWRSSEQPPCSTTLRAMKRCFRHSPTSARKVCILSWRTFPSFSSGTRMGGCTAYGFSRVHGARVAGFFTMKGGCHNPGPAAAAAGVPGYFLIGALDEPHRRANITAVFEAGRAAGRALGAFDRPLPSWTDRRLRSHVRLDRRGPCGTPSADSRCAAPCDHGNGWLARRPIERRDLDVCVLQLRRSSASWLPSEETALVGSGWRRHRS